MDILEKIYILTEEAAIATLGVGCDDWKKCKAESKGQLQLLERYTFSVEEVRSLCEKVEASLTLE